MGNDMHRATDGRTVEADHLPANEHRPERFVLTVRNSHGELLSSQRLVFDRETFLALAADMLSTYGNTIPVPPEHEDDMLLAEAIGIVPETPKRALRVVEGCE